MYSKRTILSKISNLFFLIITLFLLSFIWINYNIHNMKISIVSGLIISIAIFIIFLIINKFLSKKNNCKFNNQNQITYLKNQLLFGNDQLSIQTICQAYNFTNISITDQPNHLLDNINQKDLFFVFDSETIQESKIINILKNKKHNYLEIFCINTTQFPLQKNLQITFQNINDIYKTLLNKNCIIDYNIKIQKKTKYHLKDILSTIFGKAKSKNYFWFGLLLLFSSLFSPFNIYYIVVGTILLLLSIYSRFNRNFN